MLTSVEDCVCFILGSVATSRNVNIYWRIIMYAILSRLSAAVNVIAGPLVLLVFVLGLDQVPLGPLGSMPMVRFLVVVLAIVVVANVFAAAAGALAVDPKESDYHYDQGSSMFGLIFYTIAMIFVGVGMWMADTRINQVMDIPIAVWVLGAFVLFGAFDIGILQRGNRRWFRDQVSLRRQQQAAAQAAAAAATVATPPAGGTPAAATTTHVHSGGGWATAAVIAALIGLGILAVVYANRPGFKKTDAGSGGAVVTCEESAKFVSQTARGVVLDLTR